MSIRAIRLNLYSAGIELAKVDSVVNAEGQYKPKLINTLL